MAVKERRLDATGRETDRFLALSHAEWLICDFLIRTKAVE